MSTETPHFHATPAFRDAQPGEVAARADGETVTLTINEQRVTVPKGSNVLEAAKRIGVDLPAFCYHPGLPIAATCRQCLVKVEKAPKPMPACQAECLDGMVVDTQHPAVVDARRQMLEFTLVNHPIDCPICDKAGECKLQDLYFHHDAKRSRVDTPKVRKAKVVDVGPHIVLDQERCILCSRCIRTCDEVAGVHELTMAKRGDREVLTTAPGARLENPYSVNTVDVCPVGALTQKDFRFSMRVWELMMTPSVCNGCSTGCNIEIHHTKGRAYRLVPRYNQQVNKHWMCDEGRLTYKELHTQDRLVAPVVAGLPAAWPRALETAAAALRAALESDPGSVGVVFSPAHTNEANYVLARLARDAWQIERVYIGGQAPAPERADDILRDADLNSNGLGVTKLLGKAAGTLASLEADLASGAVRTLVVLGSEHQLSDAALSRADDLYALIVIADRELGLARHATVTLPAAAWAELDGTITNRLGTTQRMYAAFEPPGQALPAWDVLARLGRATGATLDYADARRVFDEMMTEVRELGDASWGKPAPIVQLRFAHARG